MNPLHHSSGPTAASRVFAITLLSLALGTACASKDVAKASAGSSTDVTAAGDTGAAADGGSTTDAAPQAIDYAGESNVGACAPHSRDTTRYAVVGFWKSSDCSGEPIKTNSFPINSTAGCYCWPGNSGENSADSFTCDPGAKTVTIVQYNSLTCGEGDDTPTPKTFHLNECKQDMPPTLYARVVDMGPCK